MNTFSIIVDLLLMVVLLTSIILGIKRGFVKSFIGLFKNFIAFIIAVGFSDSLGNYLSEKFVKKLVSEKVAVKIANMVVDSGIAEGGDVSSHIPKFVIDMLNFVHIDIQSKFIEPLEASIAENGGTVAGIAAVIASPIAKIISIVIAFIVLYFLSLLLLTILTKMLDKLCELPVIRTANGMLGGVLGAACGILYLWIIAKILVFVIGFGSGIPFLSFLNDFDVESTFVLKLFNNINPIKAVLLIK